MNFNLRSLLNFRARLFRDPKLFERLEQLLVALRRHEARQSPLYQAHLRRLAQPEEMNFDQLTVGYALERTARKLRPRIVLEGDRSKPVMSTICIGADYTRRVEPGTRTKIDYCRRHGYGLVILEEAPTFYDRPISWLKIPLLFRLMQMGWQSIFQIDADTLITHPAILLETFFERLERSGRHLMLVEDARNLNMGILFIRKTWQAVALLDLIYESDYDVNHIWWEQAALIELAEHHPVIRSLLHVELDSRQFNSMSFDHWMPPASPAVVEQHGWHPGDFICHLAGNPPDLELKMHKIHAQIPAADPAA
jgi:hypothetical protein